MKPTIKEDALLCLTLTYALLSLSLKHWHTVPFILVISLLRILDKFAAKSDALQASQVKTTPITFMKTYTSLFS